MPLFSNYDFGIWFCIGAAGQLVFFSRFLVQWIASERKGESVIPIAFWYLSLSGGWLLLTYSIYLRDPIFIGGQTLGILVYSRNLFLIHRKQADQNSSQEKESANVITLPEQKSQRKAG